MDVGKGREVADWRGGADSRGVECEIQVVVQFRVAGFHRWLEAEKPYNYLVNRHRHEFHFRVQKNVRNPNRETEIIYLKNLCQAYIYSKYPIAEESRISTECKGKVVVDSEAIDSSDWLRHSKVPMVDFGSLSCEEIARDLVLALGLNLVRVLEDGENGGLVYASPASNTVVDREG